MKFVHYSGAGNTFFLLDNREYHFPRDDVPSICVKHCIDGIILVEQSKIADAKMITLNRDGSEAEMCGNGLRCFIHLLKELEIHQEIYKVETVAGVHLGWFHEQEVSIQFPPPKHLRLNVANNVHFIDTGVPHAVVFVDSIETVDLLEEGKKLRYSPLFSPQGANVNFVSLESKNTLSVRTYERGVEKETPCGTGAVASALIASKIYTLSSPINVFVHSNEQLKISFSNDWSNVILQGPVKRLREGSFPIKKKNPILLKL